MEHKNMDSVNDKSLGGPAGAAPTVVSPVVEAPDFATLIAASLPDMRNYARKLCAGDDALADDCVQDACMRALEARGQFDPSRPFRPWVFTIVRNAYLQRARRSWRMLPDTDDRLAGGLGWTYEEAARASGCAVGTIKSRVSRGRALLLRALASAPEGHPAPGQDRAA